MKAQAAHAALVPVAQGFGLDPRVGDATPRNRRGKRVSASSTTLLS